MAGARSVCALSQGLAQRPAVGEQQLCSVVTTLAQPVALSRASGMRNGVGSERLLIVTLQVKRGATGLVGRPSASVRPVPPVPSAREWRSTGGPPAPRQPHWRPVPAAKPARPGRALAPEADPGSESRRGGSAREVAPLHVACLRTAGALDRRPRQAAQRRRCWVDDRSCDNDNGNDNGSWLSWRNSVSGSTQLDS